MQIEIIIVAVIVFIIMSATNQIDIYGFGVIAG